MAQKGAAELIFRGRREQKAAFPRMKPAKTRQNNAYLFDRLGGFSGGVSLDEPPCPLVL